MAGVVNYRGARSALAARARSAIPERAMINPRGFIVVALFAAALLSYSAFGPS
jgi:hypothetical protein